MATPSSTRRVPAARSAFRQTRRPMGGVFRPSPGPQLPQPPVRRRIHRARPRARGRVQKDGGVAHRPRRPRQRRHRRGLTRGTRSRTRSRTPCAFPRGRRANRPRPSAGPRILPGPRDGPPVRRRAVRPPPHHAAYGYPPPTHGYSHHADDYAGGYDVGAAVAGSSSGGKASDTYLMGALEAALGGGSGAGRSPRTVAARRRW